MIGSPLPIAILDRRLRLVDSVPTLVNLQMGNLSTACVRFDTSGPTFIATEAGKYLVMWCSSSKHETVEVSVGNPSSAAIARNQAKWQRGFFDQPMTGTWAYPTLWVDPVLTVTNQTRPFMPFGHVSHSVVVDLAQDEQFSFSVTIGHTDREWTLVAWRMPAHVQENRLQFIMNSTTDTVSAGSTITGIFSGRYELIPQGEFC